jgi:hypothetical protein
MHFTAFILNLFHLAVVSMLLICHRNHHLYLCSCIFQFMVEIIAWPGNFTKDYCHLISVSLVPIAKCRHGITTIDFSTKALKVLHVTDAVGVTCQYVVAHDMLQ